MSSYSGASSFYGSPEKLNIVLGTIEDEHHISEVLKQDKKPFEVLSTRNINCFKTK